MFHISDYLKILYHTSNNLMNYILNNSIHNLYNISPFKKFLMDIHQSTSFNIVLFDILICMFDHLIPVMDHMFLHIHYLPCLLIPSHMFQYTNYHLNNIHFYNLCIGYLNYHNTMNNTNHMKDINYYPYMNHLDNLINIVIYIIIKGDWLDN